MKASELREMSPDELVRKKDELRQALFNLRFQHGIGELENPQKMKQSRRDIARINTILRERGQNA